MHSLLVFLGYWLLAGALSVPIWYWIVRPKPLTYGNVGNGILALLGGGLALLLGVVFGIGELNDRYANVPVFKQK